VDNEPCKVLTFPLLDLNSPRRSRSKISFLQPHHVRRFSTPFPTCHHDRTMKEEAEGIAKSMPRYVRVNTLKTTFSEQKRKLVSSGHTLIKKGRKKRGGIERRKPDKKMDPRAYTFDPHIPDLLVFRPKGHSDLSRVASVESGERSSSSPACLSKLLCITAQAHTLSRVIHLPF